MHTGAAAELSDIIGDIYDCILNPDHWPVALASIGAYLGCVSGTLVMTDLVEQRLHAVKSWNFEPELIARLPEFSAESAAVWGSVDDLFQRDLDQPGSSMREAPETFAQTRWAREVMTPRNLVDSLHLIVLREPTRIGDIALYRSEMHGLCDDETLAKARLLAPHLRRAIAISNVLHMKRMEADNWKALADTLSAGVLLVTAGGEILDTNHTADTMLKARWPILSIGNSLSATLPQASASLRTAISAGLSAAGQAGSVGIALSGGNPDQLAMAYVVPLNSLAMATIFGDAAMAVFVTPGRLAPLRSLEEIGSQFDLTPTEVQHLRYILDGLSVAESAQATNVSHATANTHRQRIFRKFNVSRRAELVQMVGQLLPPTYI